MLLRRLTFRSTRSDSTRTDGGGGGGFHTETFKDDFTGNCKSGLIQIDSLYFTVSFWFYNLLFV